MANLKQLKNQIRAVEKTAQITKAMHSISASKIKKSEEALLLFEDFEGEFNNVFKIIKSKILENDIKEKKGNKKIYILISSDRGLAGSYHSQLFKEFSKIIEQDLKHSFIYTIGRKAYLYAKKKKYHLLNNSPTLNRDDIETIDLRHLATALENLFKEGSIDEVLIFYQKPLTKTTYKPNLEKILPLDFSEASPNENDKYIFDNDLDSMLFSLIHIYVETKINKAVLNSKKCEHFARLMAMKNASDNAKKVIDKLNLKYNYKRQHLITSELIDVINGAKGSE